MMIPAIRHTLVGLFAGLAIYGATALVSGQVAQQPARDSRMGPTVGTALLSGMVLTDDSSSQPVRRARVAVASADGQGVQTAYTDETGRFLVKGLPAGRYTVTATKPSYVRAAYGAKRFDRPGTPITVADGQVLSNVVLKMTRGAVISGTIVDDLGQPAPGVSVQVMQFRMSGGERMLAPVPVGSALNEATDDRGAYRVFGLPPGDYIITASPRISPGEVRQTTASDIQSVQRALQQTSTSPGTSRAPSSAPEPVMVAYATVYYPGTTVATSATTVALGPGEERVGVDFGLQLVRTAHIDGVVVTPDGVPPQSVQLLMVPSGSSADLMSMRISLNRVFPWPDGKFSYTGVMPGQYSVTARSTARPAAPSAQLWAAADVIVNGQNISGVTLTMQPGMTISGRIVAKAVGADPPADFSRARVLLSPAASSGIVVNLPNTQIDPSGRFTIQGVAPGKYRLTGGLSSPEATWNLQSATAKGKDALDLPLDVVPNENISDAVVTFTNLAQEVSGTLQDSSGRPAPDFTIVIFPADRQLWTVARRIKTTRPGTDGRYIVKNVPAGNYRIAALVDMAPGDANDPTFLEQLVAASVPFTLTDGQSKVQDLRIRTAVVLSGI